MTTVVRLSLPPGKVGGMAEELPELTRRERDVVVALCRPALDGEVFTEPATVREMAAELVVTDAAIKQHLLGPAPVIGNVP